MSEYKKPEIFNSADQIPKGAKLVEAYASSLQELFYIRNPKFKKTMPEAAPALEEFLKNHGVKEVWIHYPWHNIVVHTVEEEAYFELRTARNRNVITEAEQQKYRQLKIGIAGLSVGSAISSAVVIGGGPKNMKIADFDEVEISNLNRIRAKLTDIGRNKAAVCAREVWDVDPYAELDLWEKGISKENIVDFITKPRLDVFVDEMDSIDLKILGRLICKEHKLPVLMATDNGDSVILDVERFDLEPEREIFHGFIGKMTYEEAMNLDYRQWLKLATQIVGPEYLTESMQNSLMQIGSEIAAVPQLGTTASIAGAVCTYAMRKIANGEPMPSGRYIVGCEEKLESDYNSEEYKKRREERLQKFKEHFMKK